MIITSELFTKLFSEYPSEIELLLDTILQDL